MSPDIFALQLQLQKCQHAARFFVVGPWKPPSVPRASDSVLTKFPPPPASLSPAGRRASLTCATARGARLPAE